MQGIPPEIRDWVEQQRPREERLPVVATASYTETEKLVQYLPKGRKVTLVRLEFFLVSLAPGL
jgi:hypothetical protein